MKKIYLLSTDHLEDGLWCRDDEDFRVAMNYVAIQAASSPEVAVLAFILMSNHVHFVLKGRADELFPEQLIQSKEANRDCGISYAEAANLLDSH